VNLKQAEAFHTNETDNRNAGLVVAYQFGKETFAHKRNHADNTEKDRVD
jgi:hypothetical protein